MNLWLFSHNWASMIREGLRFFRRNRLLSVCAIAILAVGMGTSSVALNVLGVLSHPTIPGLRPGVYVTIAEASQGGALQPISWRDVQRVQTTAREFPIGAYAVPTTAAAEIGQRKFSIRLAAVSSNIFENFTAPLIAGAGFSQLDQESAATKSVVLSFKMARELFGSPFNALDKYVRVNGVELRVTGVAAEVFEGLFQKNVDAWIPPRLAVPLYFDFKSREAADAWQKARVYYVLATDPQGNGQGTAAEIIRLLRAAPFRGPRLAAVMGVTADPARNALLRTWAGLALFVAMFLALASGLSFGGLLLARAPRQLDEVRLKRTLGAGAARLCFDLVTGPALVVAVGMIGAFALAAIAMETLRRGLDGFGQLASLSRWDILLALLAQVPLAAVIAIAMALVPALRLVRDSGAPRLSYAGTGTKQSTRLLQGIVVAQIVCCICACMVAVMVARSAFDLGQQSLGYRSEDRTVLAVGARASGQFTFTTDSRGGSPMARALDRVVQRLSSLAAVSEVAVALAAPLDPSAKTLILSDPHASADQGHSVTYNGVSAAYFKVLGTPLIAGQGFSIGLMAGDPKEVIINEALRKQIWPHANPLGQVVHLEEPATGWTLNVTVAGVSADQRMAGPKESAPPTVYLPLSGNIFATSLPVYVILNGREPLFRLEAATNDELASAFPGLGVTHSYRIGDRLRRLVMDEQRRVLLALAGAVAIAVVAYIGLYSSLLYFIASKRRDLAIRICCGASRGTIFWMVLGKAAWGGLAAALISVVCWAPLRRLVSSGWIGAASWSFAAAVSITAVCFATVIAIAAFPALQASRIAPSEGIRDQT